MNEKNMELVKLELLFGNEITSDKKKVLKESLLGWTDIRRLGGRKDDGKAEPIFKCFEEEGKIKIKTTEIKKLLCFLLYKEGFPRENLLEISKNFNKALKDSSIDEFMKIFVKKRNKTNIKLLEVLVEINEEEELENSLRVYLEIFKNARENNKEIIANEEEYQSKIHNKHITLYKIYEEKVFKYLDVANITNKIYPILENIQRNKFSDNSDLKSKLLRPYRETFVKLEKFFLENNFNVKTINEDTKENLTNFLSEIRNILTSQFDILKELKEKLDYKKILEQIRPIEIKLEEFNKNKDLEEGYKNKKEDIFYCLDELLAFYSSEEGKKLDNIFKCNQIILKIFNLLISNDILVEGEHIFLSNFKLSEIYYFEDEFKSLDLEQTIFYPGYNFYFNEHIINDIYEKLRFENYIEQEKLILYIKKIIPYIEVGLDSNQSKIYENAVYSKNHNAVKVLYNNLNNLKTTDLRILTEDKYSDEIVLDSIDLLEDPYLKSYYKYIYNGNYKTLQTLYEDGINKVSEENYILEMNFCISGKKPVETSKIIFKEVERSSDNSDIFKVRFLNVAAIHGKKEVLENYVEFLKKQDPNTPELIELLSHCLNNGLIDIFMKIYSKERHDMYKIFMSFYRNINNLTKDRNIWEFIINNVFKDLDVNKKIDLEVDMSIYGLKDELLRKLPKIVESAKDNESSIALYVAYKLFPKGITNVNKYTFGRYNLVFLDKLRKESKYYKREFEAIYKIITSLKKIEIKNINIKTTILFEVICISSKGERFKVYCKFKNNEIGPEIILLKTNTNKNIMAGLYVVNDSNEAFESINKITSQSNISLLLESIKNQNIEKIKELLEQKIDVNEYDYNGVSPLILACYISNKDVIELLLKNNANPNKGIYILDLDSNQYFDYSFPLFTAINSNNLDSIKLLIEFGATVNETQIDGFTSLMAAVENENEEIITYLIKNKADVNIKRNDGVTALSLACESGNLKIVKSLVENKADINIKRNDGFTPLMIAAQFGHKDIVKFLLQKGANPNSLSNYPQFSTALLLASISGIKESVELLLEFGANINHKAENGFSALHLAAESGHESIVELLINKKINIDIQNNDGVTPLMMAVQFGYLNIVKFLQNKGANINLKSKFGWTPLMLANYCNNNNIQVTLEQMNLEKTNQYGKVIKPLRKKSNYNYKGIIEFLGSIPNLV